MNSALFLDINGVMAKQRPLSQSALFFDRDTVMDCGSAGARDEWGMNEWQTWYRAEPQRSYTQLKKYYTPDYGAYAMEDDKVKMVEQIIIETGALLVLSSSWRVYPEQRREVQRRFQRVKRKWAGITPHTNLSRGVEIQMWLIGRPDVGSFVILDDKDHDMGFVRPFVVKTDKVTGLTESDMIAAIRVLRAQQSVQPKKAVHWRARSRSRRRACRV